MSLTIGHGNGHNKRSLVELVERVNADSFSCNEAQSLLPELSRVTPEPRIIVAGSGARDRRAQSTCIVTDDRRENLGDLTRRVSERLPAHEKMAPDRWLVASFYGHPEAHKAGYEGVAHFALHPDATMMRHEPTHPIVREYRESLLSARTYMRAARRDGLLLALSGDLQATQAFDRPWGPRALIAEPLQLECRVVGIDWIMIDAALRFAGPIDVHELYDHRALIAELEAAPA